MKNSIIIFPVLLFFAFSCVYDPPPPSIRIYNMSNEPVRVIVHYNNSILNEFESADLYSDLKSYTGDFYGNCIKVTDFDTINLTGYYLLGTDCRFALRFRGPIEPLFKFNLLEIISGNDTMQVTASIDSLYEFKKLCWQQYELRIK